MRIGLFDDVADGHHRAYLAGLARAASGIADYLLVASPEPVPGLDEATSRWLHVASTKHRQMISGRGVLRKAIDTARSDNIEVFLDLFLDKSIWIWPRAGVRPARAVHVLHHAHHYLDNRGRFAGRTKTITARRRLLSLVQRGDMVAVHTIRAFEILSDFVPSERLLRVGYPIEITVPIDQPAQPPKNAMVRRILFVGQARVEKGADVLLTSLRWLPGDIEVKFVGRQDPSRRADLERFGSAQVTWVDRFVSDAELAREIDAADLIVLPYLDRFGLHGGASGVLLDALARGRPIVTTSALAPQLPAGYGGAIVIEPDDAQSLATGIMTALSDSDSLRRSAERQGPAFVKDHHSFGGYIGALLAAGHH